MDSFLEIVKYNIIVNKIVDYNVNTIIIAENIDKYNSFLIEIENMINVSYNNTFKYYKGLYYFYNKEYEKMKDILNNVVDSNVYNLMGCYYETIKIYTNAFTYYSLGRQHNNPKAMFNLARYFQHITPNKILMIKYFNMAIEHNYIDAYIHFADYYRDVEKNYIKMKELLLKAISSFNCTKAINRYSVYLYNVEKNADDAKKFLEMGVSLGCRECMNQMANIYERERNISEMVKYYTMAVQLESKKAIYKLAQYYSYTGDFQKVKEYLHYGVGLNCPISMKLLGDYYLAMEPNNNLSSKYINMYEVYKLNDLNNFMDASTQ